MRSLLLGTTLAVSALVLPRSGASGDEKKDPPKPAKSRAPVKLTEEGLRVHSEAILVDGHNDLPWQFRQKKDPPFPAIALRKHQRRRGLHPATPGLRRGGVGPQFWSASAPARSAARGTGVRETLEQIDIIHTMVKPSPAVFEMAATA